MNLLPNKLLSRREKRLNLRSGGVSDIDIVESYLIDYYFKIDGSKMLIEGRTLRAVSSTELKKFLKGNNNGSFRL